MGTHRHIAAVLAAAMAFMAIQAQAQTAREQIQDQPLKAGGVYWTGDRACMPPTPAPKGYKPFYISHYGRHGARYILNARTNDHGIIVLRKAHEEGKLTPLGESIAERAFAHYATTSGHEGDLTSLGWQQHQRLAKDMYMTYPEIFRHNPTIEAKATLVPRCIMSMAAFCGELTELRPSLTYSWSVSRGGLDGLNPHAEENPLYHAIDDGGRSGRIDPWGGTLPQYMARKIDAEAICSRIFNDMDWMRKQRNPMTFIVTDMFNFVLNMQDSESDIDLLDMFTEDELYALWEIDNYLYWNESGPRNVRDLPLLESIVKMADDAIAAYDGRPHVDLRFGHDSCLLFLESVLGVNGMDAIPDDADQIEDVWQNFWGSPMAGTLCLVFYRKGDKDDILVKATVNEEEVSLPMKPVDGPYYRWSDLRQHCLDVMEAKFYTPKLK